MKIMLTALLAMAGSVVATAPTSAAESWAAKASPQFFAVPARHHQEPARRVRGTAALRVPGQDVQGQKRSLVALNDADWRNNHYPNGKSLDDSASSIFNSSGFAIRLFRDTGHRGHVLCLAPNRGIKDLQLVEWLEDPGEPLPPRLFKMGDRVSASSAYRQNIANLHCNWRARQPPGR
ncbi:hypothetical protein ACGFNU_05430 [Spirillospora sp. NPDC048911]|uniref:hypothetical protein n=1 Tax=Spirillospora sp. NPDC048911 TaxID=3364527 RepID=UPI00371A5FA6